MESIKDSYCLRCGIEIYYGLYCETCRKIINKRKPYEKTKNNFYK